MTRTLDGFDDYDEIVFVCGECGWEGVDPETKDTYDGRLYPACPVCGEEVEDI